MRKALLVVALIAASFAGGAVVNGPGLAWVRNNLGLAALEIELKGPEKPGKAGATAHPSDPVAPLIEVPKSESKPAKVEVDAPKDAPGSATAAKSRAGDSSSPPPLFAPRTAGAKPQVTEPRTKELPKAMPSATLDLPPSALALPPRPSEPPARDSAVKQAEDTRSIASDSKQTAAFAGPAGAGSKRWGAIDQRLRALGVQRFWIEGEPGQPIRFRCVVPLVGRTAMSQMFEAEGADLESAAEVVVKRITIWRASNPD